MNIKILIVGGYGIFGGRLAELLKDEPRLTLMIAGRSLKKAKEFCNTQSTAQASLIPAQFDRHGDLDKQIVMLRPDIVVDASGPFQDYGRENYKLVEACIENGIDYLDLADGSAFVKGISEFDAHAKEKGVFVLSGVSSFPVLTALVVRELSRDFDVIESITGGIAPSPYAGVGENVIRAIAGYAGQPVPVKKDGRMTTGYPFTDTKRYTIAPPGHVPLRNILFSLVDVPDLRVLPELWPDVKTIWMGAGPVPEILHRILIGFSWLVRWKMLPSLTAIVKLIRFVMNTVRWGEHRGGMFVELRGQKSGKNFSKSWHLLAEGRDGPYIPSMAIEAIIRKILRGESVPPGARTAINDLDLADYNALFARKTIYTGFRSDEDARLPLYRRILSSSYASLPSQIQEMHDLETDARVKGLARIERGSNPLAAMVADIIGFPKAGVDIPVTVKFSVKDGVEAWTRTFGDASFTSWQSEGRGRDARLMVERFGPMSFAMALVPENQRLNLVLRSWKFLGIPMPMFLCPKSDSYETVVDGRFNFHVHISHPLVGLIVHYRGWLERS